MSTASELYDFDLCVLVEGCDRPVYFDLRGLEVGGGAQDKGAQSKIVEHVAAVSPYVRGPVLAVTLVVETVHGRDLPALVVTPDESDAVRVAGFQAEEEHERFEGVEAPVDKVAHE